MWISFYEYGFVKEHPKNLFVHLPQSCRYHLSRSNKFQSDNFSNYLALQNPRRLLRAGLKAFCNQNILRIDRIDL